MTVTRYKNVTKKGVVVMWGGTKDVGKNETRNGLSQLKDFVRGNNHTSTIQMCVTHILFICELL
jgi:hypothetical protein